MIISLVVASSVALAGCATSADGDGTPPSGGTGTGASTPAGDTDPETGADTDGGGVSASYAFTADTLAGDTFDGRSLAGKPAVLWFWAPWCPTCLGQAARVNSLAADYADTASVVGVAGLDGVPAMHDFVELAELSGFPQLADEQGAVWRHFEITAQSTFVVLDADGEVVDKGHVDVDALPGMLDRLIAG
ncbi:redoxin domain-containing protein [Solwaraspora sp. WMMD792]|uniref:redoxin domain-containing protein n=1 Tax=Solwaraspora sp. WMMD792 TaxID=3016099 RepID=UPI002417A193|nr:redoxin domain-containing protein [Solwaraspora sp. WMMD792]MDG4773672.1 redoxin domain-containing protein [Solwaraspora sp. WMMD792]